MKRPEIIPFSDSAALAQAVAEAWLKRLAQLGASTAPFCVALSGGRIARQFFTVVTRLAQAGGVNFERVHFFWADERCVPPTDSESNFAMARDLLLAPLRIPDGQIHRIRGEAPPDQGAIEAEAELRRFAPIEKGQPVLDLVFLGMGEDGHVASLFPGEPAAVLANPAVYRAVKAAKPPPRRITLGYRGLVMAREVCVLVSGEGKAGALRASLLQAAVTPLGRVLGQRAHTRLYVEEKILP